MAFLGLPGLLTLLPFGLGDKPLGGGVIVGDGLHQITGRTLGNPLILLLKKPVEHVNLGLDEIGRVPLCQLLGRGLGHATVDQLGNEGRGLPAFGIAGWRAGQGEAAAFWIRRTFQSLAVLGEAVAIGQRLKESDRFQFRDSWQELAFEVGRAVVVAA